MMPTAARAGIVGAVLAPLGVLLALAVALATRAGYDPYAHTLAGLGMQGAAHAGFFNLSAFVLPGLLLAAAAPALAVRLERDGLGATGRIALHMLLLAALAFAAQGLWRFDPQEPDDGASRWHAAANGVSQIAWIAATLLFAVASAGLRGGRGVATVAGLALIAMLVCVAWLPTAVNRPGLVQLIALAAFFSWPLAASVAALRTRGGTPT
jgi:hypothetical protein